MFELTEQALEFLVNQFVIKLKERIARQAYPYGNPDVKGIGNKIASGSLYESISGSVEIGTDGIPYAVITYNDYLKYVQRGRGINVKRVPLQALLNWINIRGIQVQDIRGNNIPPLSLAFAIQTNIYRYGIRPADIYDRGIDDLEDLFNDFPNNLPPELQLVANELFEEVSNDINIFIEQTIEKQIETINNL